MEKVWVSIFVATTVFISIEMASLEIMSNPTKVVVTKPKPFESDMKLGRSIDKELKGKKSSNLIMENKTVHMNGSSEHPEVAEWPSVFVLHHDPTNPTVCYSGHSININKDSHNDLEISTIKEAGVNSTSPRENKKFVLSSNPLFPVICQEIHIPEASMNNETAQEGNATSPNGTCIRRDYEHGISAVFIHEAGPIGIAFNIFNSTIPYDFFNIKHLEMYGEIKPIKDTIVDCKEYGVINDDKTLSQGAIASLLGTG